MPAAKPPEFRRRAVDLVRRGEQSVPQIAKDLGISESCLRRWVSVDDVDTGRREGTSSDERKELVELRRRNRVLEMENEILRRASAYFARENVLPLRSSSRRIARSDGVGSGSSARLSAPVGDDPFCVVTGEFGRQVIADRGGVSEAAVTWMPRLAAASGRPISRVMGLPRMAAAQDPIAVFVGVDVGKTAHHAVALTAAGVVLLDEALPQDEAKLRTVIDRLIGQGRVLFVVDQPATIGALPLAVARDAGVEVGYLPGLAMRRIADLHPGEAKTDARDAAIIAQAARSMPHALRSLRAADERTAALAMLAGFDEDLAAQISQTSNRIRGLLTQIHPALERVLGPRMQHPAVIDLLQRYPTPEAMRAAGRARMASRLRKLAPRLGEQLASQIAQALTEQTVVVTGTAAAGQVLPRLAEQLGTLRRQRGEIADQVEALVDAHPLSAVLISMPGVGFRTVARIITETSGREFRTAGHLAAYVGLAPVSRRSGTSIRGEHQSRGGNKRLKRALYLSAFSALHEPNSRAYYDRKRSERKSHKQALMALARRRCDVLFAMLRDGALYDPAHALAA